MIDLRTYQQQLNDMLELVEMAIKNKEVGDDGSNSSNNRIISASFLQRIGAALNLDEKYAATEGEYRKSIKGADGNHPAAAKVMSMKSRKELRAAPTHPRSLSATFIPFIPKVCFSKL